MERVRDIQGLKRGVMSIGTIDAAAIYILPGVFNEFKARYPGIEINLEIASTVPLLKELNEGRLDAVCGTLPVDSNGHRCIFKVFTESLVFIAPPDHPLSDEKDLKASDLADYPFISFQSESITRKIIEKALMERGVSVEVSMAIDSQEAIKHLVASGLGLSALPLKTVEEEIRTGALRTLKIEGVRLTREIGLILPSGRYLPAAVRAFLSIMRSILKVDIPNKYCMSQGEK
jgi:DNA-binding transcriptional LysR family regulator